jgi:periplasmic protein TonB
MHLSKPCFYQTCKVMTTKKDIHADIDRYKVIFLETGIMLSLLIVLLTINIRSLEKKVDRFSLPSSVITETETIPVTRQEPPPVPPAPAPASELLIVADTEEQVENLALNVDATMETVVKPIMLAPVPTQAEEKPVEEPEIFVIVEEMPRYPGGEAARLRFFSENLRYPVMAREAGIKGTVFVAFVVGEDGSITDVKLLRGIGGGCDEEAIRVVRLMPKWIPGRQRGQAVKVHYNMPIRFELN